MMKKYLSVERTTNQQKESIQRIKEAVCLFSSSAETGFHFMLSPLQSQIVKSYPHWFSGVDNNYRLKKALTLVKQIHSDARYRSALKVCNVYGEGSDN
jgi:hypothetical protein